MIDARNNIFAVLPRSPGATTPLMQFAYCRDTNLAFGRNWVSPGWVSGTAGTLFGTGSFVSPRGNSPGFVSSTDLHLTSGASAARIGGALAVEVAKNSLGLSLVPSLQYQEHQSVVPRTTSGAGADAGAFELGRRR